MVYKHSEYGHQFKVSSLIRNVPVYKDNLNYRHFRREREFAHTPLSWDCEVVESSDSDEKLNDEEEIPISKLAIQEEDENGGDEVQKSDNELCDTDDEIAIEKRKAQRKDHKTEVEEDKCEVVVTKQNEALRKSAKQKLNKYASSKNKNEVSSSKDVMDKKVFGKTFSKPIQADEKLFVKSSKPRRPDRQQKIPKARPQSAPIGRPLTQGVETSQPFINYGCGSSNRSVGDKKTFNVKAACAVYPAALRAKKRNQLLIEKLKEKARAASAREKRRLARFNEQLAREAAIWDTEYRRSFPCYKNTVYATSDKDPRKKKSFFVN